MNFEVFWVNFLKNTFNFYKLVSEFVFEHSICPV